MNWACWSKLAFSTHKCGLVMQWRPSVCRSLGLTVWDLTFESLDVQTSFLVDRCRVLTTLENLEILRNLLILDNSGNLKYTRQFLYIRCYFYDAVWNTQQADVAQLQWYLCEQLVVVYQILVDMIILGCKNMFCNSATEIPKWLLRWSVTLAFNVIIV